MTAALTLSLSLAEGLPSLPANIPPGTDAANTYILMQVGFAQQCRYVPGMDWRHYQGGVWRDVENIDLLLKPVGELLQAVVARYIGHPECGTNSPGRYEAPVAVVA